MGKDTVDVLSDPRQGYVVFCVLFLSATTGGFLFPSRQEKNSLSRFFFGGGDLSAGHTCYSGALAEN